MSAAIVREMAKYNETYTAHPPATTRFRDFPNEKAILILTCMDPRSNAYEFWNIGFGPGVLRNAGGRATEDALRSMRALSVFMANGKNTLGAVVVIHHKDCGLHHGPNFSDDFVRNKLAERVPERADEAKKLWVGSFGDDVAASVREDMIIIMNDPWLPKDLDVLGYVHDSQTGKTEEVLLWNDKSPPKGQL
ncbi:hypothetical protein LTR15_010946 [Elasticomyces elasticus]|nr:hypothetical protein LTR15_010946 [Elasticomyces elasticus]